MNINKTELYPQILLLIPAIVFLSLYGHFSFPVLTIILSLLGLLIYSIVRTLQQKPILKHSAVFTLIGTFLLYGFSHLGSLNTPQSFENMKATESVVHLKLTQASPIDKLCYYVGIDYDSFSLEAQQKNRWKQFYHYKKGYPYSFSWKCKNVSVKQTTEVLLRPTENEKLVWSTDNDLMIGELRFFYKDKLLTYTSDKPALNDEPQTTIDKTYYGSMFFDEIYFGRTAYELSHNLPIYENTHPYLGKHLVGIGTKIFGMTPFGWRFMGMLCAALMVWFIYILALELFKKPLFALGTAVLLAYSFMHFTQSRLALIDSFGVTFVLGAYYYLYRFIKEQHLKLLLLSGLFFGLAISIKWSAVFASLGFLLIAVYLLVSRYPLHKRFAGVNLIKYGLLAYGVIALSIYLLSFFDIFMQGGTLQTVIDYNTNMYHYHSTLIASHPYSSPWWSWPLDMKPMGYYKQAHGTLTSSINAFGNPAIFWIGIVAFFYTIITLFKRHTLESIFLLLAFLGLYMPYIFIGRLMFIYHFYYAVPFFILIIVYMFSDLSKQFLIVRKVFFVYLLIVVALFLAFYPVLSGYEIDKNYVKEWLIWLPKWWL